MAAAASTIFSIPGCEQPTTNTMPSEVFTARDSSLSSFVPGASDTNAIRVMPGAISVVLSINSKLAPRHAAPKLHDLRWCAFVVAHLRRQRLIFSVEARRQRRTVD